MTSLIENAIKAGRLLEMRDVLKRCVPKERYAELIVGWKRSVRETMQRSDASAIEAFIALGHAARSAGDADGVAVLWLAAAAVEVIEEDSAPGGEP